MKNWFYFRKTCQWWKSPAGKRFNFALPEVHLIVTLFTFQFIIQRAFSFFILQSTYLRLKHKHNSVELDVNYKVSQRHGLSTNVFCFRYYSIWSAFCRISKRIHSIPLKNLQLTKKYTRIYSLYNLDFFSIQIDPIANCKRTWICLFSTAISEDFGLEKILFRFHSFGTLEKHSKWNHMLQWLLPRILCNRKASISFG